MGPNLELDEVHFGTVMVRGDRCGSISQGRLGRIWLVATQDIQHRVAGEAPICGAQLGVPEQIFWGNILRNIPYRTNIFYSIVDRHLMRLYRGGAPHSMYHILSERERTQYSRKPFIESLSRLPSKLHSGSARVDSTITVTRAHSKVLCSSSFL